MAFASRCAQWTWQLLLRQPRLWVLVPLLQATKKSGIPYTIIRLPLFTDNIWCV
jgi:hypothetical protein